MAADNAMNGWNRDDMAQLLAECGEIALKHWESPAADYKKDLSLVTQADREIERFLGESFDVPGKDSYLIGEETLERRDENYLHAAFDATAWVVDPIDGTALYANHLPCWGVSVGRMEKSRLTDGAVYFPLEDELFISEAGRVWHGTSNALEPMEAVRPSYSVGGVIAITQEIARFVGIEVSNPVYAGGSAVYPLTQLLFGRFIAYVGQLNLWDAAGSIPLLCNAGIELGLEDGTPVDANVTDSAYFLARGEARRWKYRANLVCASSPETREVVVQGLAKARARRRTD